MEEHVREIGLEASSVVHFLGRALRKQEHNVRLIRAHFVKPFVKSNKNDCIDEEPIPNRKDERTKPHDLPRWEIRHRGCAGGESTCIMGAVSFRLLPTLDCALRFD